MLIVDLQADLNMAEEHHDVHFESADAGASLTYPQAAGTVRKNGFLVIKGRPCKVRTGHTASFLVQQLVKMAWVMDDVALSSATQAL